jgi:anaphase-promoting complex subunit 10
LYLDYNLDESYTPKHLSVQVGMTTQDLIPAIFPVNTVVEFQEPVGWCIIPLTAPPDPLDDDEDELESSATGGGGGHTTNPRRLVRTHLIQISVISMHQNGRDTHVRQVQLYGPRSASMMPSSFAPIKDPSEESAITSSNSRPGHSKQRRHMDDKFTTVAMSQYSTIR